MYILPHVVCCAGLVALDEGTPYHVTTRMRDDSFSVGRSHATLIVAGGAKELYLLTNSNAINLTCH